LDFGAVDIFATGKLSEQQPKDLPNGPLAKHQEQTNDGDMVDVLKLSATEILAKLAEQQPRDLPNGPLALDPITITGDPWNQPHGPQALEPIAITEEPWKQPDGPRALDPISIAEEPWKQPDGPRALDPIAITEDPWNQSRDFFSINEIFEQAARLVPEVSHPSRTYNIDGKT